jgi:hypothetical protein
VRTMTPPAVSAGRRPTVAAVVPAGGISIFRQRRRSLVLMRRLLDAALLASSV